MHHEIFGLGPGFEEGALAEGNGGDRREHALLGDPVQVVLRLHGRKGLRIAWRLVRPGPKVARSLPLPAESALADGDELVGLVEWQRAEHDGVHDREDGGGGADAERQHDECDDSEARCGAEPAHGFRRSAMRPSHENGRLAAGGAGSAHRDCRSGAR